MTSNTQNLRKAAVFIRSLDADTAANLLAQLSPDEAQEIRAAIRALGSLDPDEQADVAAEFRRTKPVASRSGAQGVELELSSAAAGNSIVPLCELPLSRKRFEFLEQAPVEALVRFLSREHVQTIAVVLSFLPPERAAAVLAALPATLQAEAIERLSVLGDTDPDSLTVLERELSEWLAQRSPDRNGTARRGDTVLAILAATDATTRGDIMTNLSNHKALLAKQLTQFLPVKSPREDGRAKPLGRWNIQAEGLGTGDWRSRRKSPQKSPTHVPQSPLPIPQPATSSFAFDDLLLLSAAELATVLRDVDANVLVLALVGSSDELVERICEHLPRRTAKAFRRQLGRLGPTRLSDVEAAQRLVASVAGRQLRGQQSRARTLTK